MTGGKNAPEGGEGKREDRISGELLSFYPLKFYFLVGALGYKMITQKCLGKGSLV